MSPVAIEQFGRALRGEPCDVVGPGNTRSALPLGDWIREADRDDLAFLDHCDGPTIDIGCGPGRMTAALARSGRVALGVDLAGEAVAATNRRGGTALLRDLHRPLPGEGRWREALLIDGNIGIGGDPVALLRRVVAMLAPGGQVVAEVREPGVETAVTRLRLDCGGRRSETFPWAFVGADGVTAIADDAGLRVADVHPHGRRWCAVLEAR